MLKHLIPATLVCSTALFCLSAKAVTIYDNSSNDLLTRFHSGSLQVGDEITLAGTERMLTGFSFEYFGLNQAGGATFAGSVQARVRFYLNDGAPFNTYATPSTTFFDSGLFNVSPTTRATVNFSTTDLYSGNTINLSGPIPVVANFTWSVQFQLSNATDDVGLDLFSPPTVGGHTPDYWENNGSGWVLKQNANGVPPVNFAARFDATNVPEATTTVQLVGGAVALLVGWRMRKS